RHRSGHEPPRIERDRCGQTGAVERDLDEPFVAVSRETDLRVATHAPGVGCERRGASQPRVARRIECFDETLAEPQPGETLTEANAVARAMDARLPKDA